MDDYISREAAAGQLRSYKIERDLMVSHNDTIDFAISVISAEVPAADVVEVVRCKDCIYWRDSYVKENDGTERQYRDDDVDPIGMRGVTIDIGINVGSMCLLEENKCGWKLNKSIFRNENDFCSRGERRPCSYEEWWGIVDGVYHKVVEIDQVKEGAE